MEEPTQEVGYRGVCRIDANPILETLLAVRPCGRDDELVSQRRICSPHREEPALVKRLLGEACAAVGVRHQNVVEVREVMLAGMSIVAEYVEGETLRSLLQRRLPLPVVHAIGRGVAAALEHLHSEELEVAHQALSPASIVVTERGVVKLDDVGVMRVLIEHPACVQLARQVLRYAAPETRRGKMARPEEDLYALGALLHEALTGEPFSKEQPPHPAVMNPDVTPPIDELVAGLLHHEPARRPTAHQALLQLNAAPRAQPEQLGRLVKALAEGKPRPSTLVGQLAAQRTVRTENQLEKPRALPRATPRSVHDHQPTSATRTKRFTPVTAVTQHPARSSPAELAAMAASALPPSAPSRPPLAKPPSKLAAQPATQPSSKSPTKPATRPPPTPSAAPRPPRLPAAKLAMGSSPRNPVLPATPPPLALAPAATPHVNEAVAQAVHDAATAPMPAPVSDALTDVEREAAEAVNELAMELPTDVWTGSLANLPERFPSRPQPLQPSLQPSLRPSPRPSPPAAANRAGTSTTVVDEPLPQPAAKQPARRADVRTTLRTALVALGAPEKILPRQSRHSAFTAEDDDAQPAPPPPHPATIRRRRLLVAALLVGVGLSQWPAVSQRVVRASSSVLQAFTGEKPPDAPPPPPAAKPAR